MAQAVEAVQAQAKRRVGTKRRWGYLVWVAAALMLVVPEITAAISHGALGFVTASETIGHIERYHNWVELGVVGAIVLIVFSLLQVRLDKVGQTPDDGKATRTPGGRLTFHPQDLKDAKEFDDEGAPVAFVVYAVASAALIAFAGWAAREWWDDPRRFHASILIYALVALLWFVVPSIVAFVRGSDVAYPTMVRTVQNLADWFRKQDTWPWQLGPKLAWFVTFVIIWGLVILFVHLTFYPYPDITHVINPSG
jgi:hypothetical protein